MTDDFDIFKRLGQHEVEPPAGMFLRIIKDLDDDSATNDAGDRSLLPGGILQLQEIEVSPPAWLLSSIETEIASSQLFMVKDPEDRLPGSSFSTIMRSIKEDESDMGKEKSFVRIFLRHRYKWAAAVVMLFVAGWFIYRLTIVSGQLKKEVALQTNSTQSFEKNKTAGNGPPTLKKDSIVHRSSFAVSADDFFYNRRVSIDDYKFQLVDNDLLTTFAGFGYAEVPDFLGRQAGNIFRIRVDQYSNITVSESMSKMIRNMNQYRKNKKPTRRARKEKAKLERWKKTDAGHFDKSLIKNPLDAIDLAEYVF